MPNSGGVSPNTGSGQRFTTPRFRVSAADGWFGRVSGTCLRYVLSLNLRRPSTAFPPLEVCQG